MAIEALQETIDKFQKKWEMSFEEFKRHFKEGTLKEGSYSFSTEKDYWQWEEAETLKKHYEDIKGQ